MLATQWTGEEGDLDLPLLVWLLIAVLNRLKYLLVTLLNILDSLILATLVSLIFLLEV